MIPMPIIPMVNANWWGLASAKSMDMDLESGERGVLAEIDGLSDKPRGPNRRGWCGPLIRPCHQGPFPPRTSSRLRLFMVTLVSEENLRPIFTIFLSRQRRWNPHSTSERADLLLRPVGNHCHCLHRLLLGVGRSIFITIFIILNVIPLIVCGRSNPGYSLRAVCMFVLGILSLFCGKVILSDCVVSIPTNHDHVWHLWVVFVVPGGIGWIGQDFYVICNEYLVKIWYFMGFYDGNVWMSTGLTSLHFRVIKRIRNEGET
jgi:hypothetical protein